MNTSKIVCLGDSLTQGYNLPIASRWTTLLQSAIKPEIVNCGINGDTTAGMLARFSHVFEKHQPSHLIILGGTNDLWFGLTNAQIIANIHAIVRQARYNNVLPIVGIPTSIMDTNQKNNLKENYSDRMSQFQQELKDHCVADDQLYIPFYENMSESHFSVDKLHPNLAGQEVIKQQALLFLNQIL